MEHDLERAGRITATRAFSAAANHVAVNETPLAEGTAEDEVITGFRNGTIAGTEQLLLNETSFDDWNDRVQSLTRDAGWDLDVRFVGASTASEEPVTVSFDARFNLSLYHPPSRTSFERTVDRNYTVSIMNVTDPLLFLETDGQYAQVFTACPTTERAEKLGEGTDYHYDTGESWTSGRSVVRPDNEDVDTVEDRDEKILVVEDICAFDESTVEDEFPDFNGVISETERPMENDGSTVCDDVDSSGIDAYISGVDTITETLPADTMTVMTGEATWRNNILDEVGSTCYFANDGGPTIFDRLEGKLSSSERGTGWSAFVNIPDLPAAYQDTSRSAVDHVYFSDDSTDNSKIKGVSDHHEWFELDQDHIDAWAINDLAYD